MSRVPILPALLIRGFFGLRGLAAVAMLGAAASATASHPPTIPAPPSAAIERAWRSIDDPQLAAQLRPGRRLEPEECVVLLGLYRPSATRRQRSAVDHAGDAWRARLVRRLGEAGARQMIGSSVNPLAPTPPPLRQAAASWCVAHAPPR
ncbi:MAG: hypothetical protein E6G92_05235 [Alphaproteobacteria bacterium]|nr:MAG: hypothetical protein E6G92_05235 [Alphaproteobacteria bacterium]